MRWRVPLAMGILAVALALVGSGHTQSVTTPVEIAFASLGNHLVIAYGYDPASANPWKSYDPSAPPFANQLREVEPLGGYFVRVDQDVDFTVGPLSKRLKAGWNLVGWPGGVATGPGLTPMPAALPRAILTPTVAPGLADLTISKAQQGTFPIGGIGTYVITVQNLGPGTAGPAFQVNETLPLGFTFVPGSASPPWTCSVAIPFNFPNNEVVSCFYSGSLPPGGSLTFTIQVNVSPLAAVPPGPNCANVSYAQDVNAANNQSCVSTVLGPTATPTPTPAAAPDLTAQKFLNSPFHYGQPASYTMLVSNVGTGTANSPITVVDVLPNGITYLSYSDPYSTYWSCSASGQIVTCTYTGPDIAPGGFLPTLIINVQIAPVGSFPGGSDSVENCAEARHPADGNSLNNQGCVTAVITP